MRRARRDWALSAGVVLGSRYGLDNVTVAVAQLEHLLGDVGPGRDPARAGQVVGAVLARAARLLVASTVAQKPEDALGHVAGEGEAAVLVADHRHLVERIVGVGAAV